MPLNEQAIGRRRTAIPAGDVRALDLAEGSLTARRRMLAVETPVNIIYAPIPFAVMMTSPSDLEDFAYGFSFTEGIIDGASDIRSVAVEEAEGGLKLIVSLAPDKMQRHLARGRNISGRTGCGLCGIDDLAAMPQAADNGAPPQDIALSAINAALSSVGERQTLNRTTQSVHAAAWCDLSGAILAIREDVGRHNALDKLIGAALRADTKPVDGFLLITSRASFEMIEKAAIFGARTVVAISAPTALAVERARGHRMTLLAMARNGAALVFNGAEHIRSETAHER